MLFKDLMLINRKVKLQLLEIKKHQHLDFLNPQLLQTPSRLMSRVLDVGFNQPGTGDEQIKAVKDAGQSKPNDNSTKNLVQSVMRYNQLYSMRVNITIAGNLTLHAGDAIYLDFPGLEQKILLILTIEMGDYIL